MANLHTYNVELTATYTVNAQNEDDAVEKARVIAEWGDFYDYVEEIEYDPEYGDEEE